MTVEECDDDVADERPYRPPLASLCSPAFRGTRTGREGGIAPRVPLIRILVTLGQDENPDDAIDGCEVSV